jgi:hypothetical protein
MAVFLIKQSAFYWLHVLSQINYLPLLLVSYLKNQCRIYIFFCSSSHLAGIAQSLLARRARYRSSIPSRCHFYLVHEVQTGSGLAQPFTQRALWFFPQLKAVRT